MEIDINGNFIEHERNEKMPFTFIDDQQTNLEDVTLNILNLVTNFDNVLLTNLVDEIDEIDSVTQAMEECKLISSYVNYFIEQYELDSISTTCKIFINLIFAEVIDRVNKNIFWSEPEDDDI